MRPVFVLSVEPMGQKCCAPLPQLSIGGCGGERRACGTPTGQQWPHPRAYFGVRNTNHLSGRSWMLPGGG